LKINILVVCWINNNLFDNRIFKLLLPMMLLPMLPMLQAIV